MANHPNGDELREQLRMAMEGWYASEDAALWDSTTGDGLDDDPAWAALLPARDDSGGASRRR